MHRSSIAAAVIVLCCSSTATAALLETDLLESGDGLLTRDLQSGLDWLDVTATFEMSFDDIRRDVGGYLSLGFRHATGEEICGLLSANVGGAPTPCPGGSVAIEDQRALTDLVSLLGDTGSPSGPVTFGIFDDGSLDGGVGAARFFQLAEGPGRASVDVELDVLSTDSTLAGGNYLVRAVPEPVSVGFVGLSVLIVWSINCASRKRNSLG